MCTQNSFVHDLREAAEIIKEKRERKGKERERKRKEMEISLAYWLIGIECSKQDKQIHLWTKGQQSQQWTFLSLCFVFMSVANGIAPGVMCSDFIPGMKVRKNLLKRLEF